MNLVEEQRSLQAQAWRIAFADKALADKTPLAVIRRPRAAWAYAQPVDPATVLATVDAPAASVDDFTFVFVPAGEVTPYETQKQVESWIASRPGESGSPIEIQFRSERLIWRRRRAACFGAPQALDGVLAGVSHFAFCERELGRIEEKIEESWPALQNDAHLAGSLSGRDLKNRPHVGTMSRTAVAMLIDYARIESALEAPAAELTGLSRRLFAELAVQANVVDRLRLLDDSVKVIDDFYRLAHERLFDLRSYFSEVRGNTLILLVLIVELLITIYGVFGTEIANYLK
jgi:hypothetical protein